MRRLIAAHLGVDPGSLHADTDLRLDADAMRGVARALERSFSVALDEPELSRLHSCRELSMLVARRVAEREGPARSGRRHRSGCASSPPTRPARCSSGGSS